MIKAVLFMLIVSQISCASAVSFAISAAGSVVGDVAMDEYRESQCGRSK